MNLTLDPLTYRFYQRIAEAADLPIEQVCRDALFRLAGELSQTALHR